MQEEAQGQGDGPGGEKLPNALAGLQIGLQPAPGGQAEDHGAQGGYEAEGRVAAAVVGERPLAGEEVQEPGVERPCRVRVLVPMRGEAGELVRPVGGDAGPDPVEPRARQRIERERGPVAGEQGDEGDPLLALGSEPEPEEHDVAQADLAQGVLEREIRLGPVEGAEHDAEGHQDDRAPCRVAEHRGGALALRAAAGQRERNEGWMMSWSEQPTHSVWVCWSATKAQKKLPGWLAATRARLSTSAIIKSMTQPR